MKSYGESSDDLSMSDKSWGFQIHMVKYSGTVSCTVSKAFLLTLAENMIYFQRTLLYCDPHCNKTVHDLSQVPKHTPVIYPKYQLSGVALWQAPGRAVKSSKSSVSAISAVASHAVPKEDSVSPSKRGTEE